MQRYRDDLFEEWYLELKMEFGVDKANRRFGQIMGYFFASDVSLFFEESGVEF
jgi:hypothetical protein